MDMIVLADDDGVIDMTEDSIAARTRVPIDEVKSCITYLEQADPDSRTPDEDGRRLIKISPHRSWGWRIVNYRRYRESASKEMIRMAEAERKAAYRRKYGKTSSPTPPPKIEEIDREERRPVPDLSRTGAGQVPDKGAVEPRSAAKISNCDEEYLKALAADPTYRGIDVKFELGKMSRWCETNRKQPTRKRFVNWLNRIDRPMTAEAHSASSPSRPTTTTIQENFE